MKVLQEADKGMQVSKKSAVDYMCALKPFANEVVLMICLRFTFLQILLYLLKTSFASQNMVINQSE